MITRNLINPNIKIFNYGEKADFDSLSNKIDKFKISLSQVKQSGRMVSLAFPKLNIDNLAFIFALLELKIPIININTPDLIYHDPHIKNSIIFSDTDVISLYFTKESDCKIIDIFDDTFVINDTASDINIDAFTSDDEVVLVYFSSGSTGAPKTFYHSHDSVKTSAVNSKQFYENCSSCFWFDNQTLNHFGIFTTTVLPSLMYCDNIIIGDKLNSAGEVPPIDILTVFSHNLGAIDQTSSLAKSVKVITGGSIQNVKSAFLKLNSIHEIQSLLFNVYGCTELSTPLMWNEIRLPQQGITEGQYELFTFDKFIPGLEIVFDDFDNVLGFKHNPAFYHSNPSKSDYLEVFDNLIKSSESITFIDRKENFVLIDGYDKSGIKKVKITGTLVNDFCRETFGDNTPFAVISHSSVTNKGFIIALQSEGSFSISEFSLKTKFAKFVLKTLNVQILLEFLENLLLMVIEVPHLNKYNNGLKFDVQKFRKDYETRILSGNSN